MLHSATLPSRAAFTSGNLKSIRPQRVSVITHVKPTRMTDFKDLTDEEIVVKVGELKNQLFDLRLRAVSNNFQGSPNEKELNPPKAHEFGHVRRQVAQLLTLKRQRTLAEGVDKRAARAIEQQERVLAGFGNI